MAHPIGGIIYHIVGSCLFGFLTTYSEKNYAEYSLPLFVKRILFLWVPNKFTLNTIIYQSLSFSLN